MQQQMLNARSRARRTIASYPTYAEAQRAVDALSDQHFPVEHVAIVAEGLQVVEQVTGRLGYGRAALNGALSGAFTGALIGFIWGLFSVIQPLVSALNLALFGIVVGAVIGAITGVIGYVVSGGKRDFTSVSGIQAERYHIMIDDQAADEAERLLIANTLRQTDVSNV